MRAALLREPGQLAVTEVADPEPGPDEVLLRMRAVGLCGSDLHTYRGHHPFRRPPVVLGHEGAAEVVAVPDGVPGVAVGDRVAIMPSLSCWACARCEAGRPHLCVAKRVPGSGWTGFLGEYTTAPARVLYPLAEGVDYAQGALVEPLAVAWHAARTGGVRAGQSVAVLGGGAIGCLVAAVCQLSHVDSVLVSDVKPHNLRFLAEQDIGTPVDARGRDVVSAGRAVVGGDGFDVVVIASGHPSGLTEALALCRPRGKVVVLPMFAHDITADLNPVVLKEIRLLGSTTYTPADFRAATNLVNRGELDVRPFITETRPLADAPTVLADMDRGRDYLKLQIDPTR